MAREAVRGEPYSQARYLKAARALKALENLLDKEKEGCRGRRL